MKLAILLLLPLFQVQAVSPIRSLINENRLEEALPICRQFEVLSSSDRDNFLTCAWVFLGLDKLESGEKFIQKLVKLDPGLEELHLLQGFLSLKKKNFENGKQIIDSVASTARGTPLYFKAQELLGDYYENKGQLATAAFIYTQISKEQPQNGRAHWGLGRYYLSKGEPRKAETHLLKTISLWPKHLGSRFNLSVLYLNEGNLFEAAKYLAECYKLNRSDPTVLEQIGILMEKKKRYAEALKNWQKALDLNPESVIAKEKIGKYFNELVISLYEKQKYRSVIAELQKKKDLVEKDAKLKLLRASSHKELGEFEQAIVDYRAYVKQTPTDAKALQDLGICYLNMKLYDDAGLEFEKASRLQPENGLIYAWLAYVLESKNDFATARVYFKKALDFLTDPKEIEKASRKLSSIDRKLNDLEKKKKAREKKNKEDHGEEEDF